MVCIRFTLGIEHSTGFDKCIMCPPFQYHRTASPPRTAPVLRLCILPPPTPTPRPLSFLSPLGLPCVEWVGFRAAQRRGGESVRGGGGGGPRGCDAGKEGAGPGGGPPLTPLTLFAQGCAAMPNSTGTAGSHGGRGAAWSRRRPTATRDPSSTSSGSARGASPPAWGRRARRGLETPGNLFRTSSVRSDGD